MTLWEFSERGGMWRPFWSDDIYSQSLADYELEIKRKKEKEIRKMKIQSSKDKAKFKILEGKEKELDKMIENNIDDGYSNYALDFALDCLSYIEKYITNNNTIKVIDIDKEAMKFAEKNYKELTNNQTGLFYYAIKNIWFYSFKVI